MPWWSEQVEDTDVDLYIGQAAYRAGEDGWEDEDSLSTQLDYNTDHSEVDGDVFFSFKSLTNVAEDAFEHLSDEHYDDPALPPLADDSREGEPQVGPVEDLTAEADDERTQLEWEPAEGASSYVVYELDPEEAALVDSGDPEQYCDVLSEDNLVEVTGQTSAEAEGLDEDEDEEEDDESPAYVVTALDDYRVEGAVGDIADPRR